MTDDSNSTLIGITASFTPQLLVRPMLRAAPEGAQVVSADFNQLHQTLMDVRSSFEQVPDLLVVLWRIEDVFGPALTEWVVESGDHCGLREDVRQLGTLVRQAAREIGISLVVGTPPVPELPWLDPFDTRSSVRMNILHGQLLDLRPRPLRVDVIGGER